MSLGTPTARKKPRPAARRTNNKSFKPAPSPENWLPAGCEPREDWECWSAHLATREAPRPLEQMLPPGKCNPLEWALADDDRLSSQSTLRLGAIAGRQTPRLVAAAEAFVSTRGSVHSLLKEAVETLAWCHALPALSAVFAPDLWWKLLDRLLDLARDSAGVSLAEQPLEAQMLAGELPLSLAYFFPELPECRALLEPARAALSRGPSDLLDGEGVVAARYMPLLRPLLAVWTRSSYLGRELGGCFSPPARAEFEWFVRHALRFTRHDGRQMLTAGPGGAWQPELFAAALALRNDWEDGQIADCVLPGRHSPRTPAARRELPPPQTHSEWAESGVLRYDWHRGGDVLALTFHEGRIQAEFNCGPDLLWSGDWSPRVSIDGVEHCPTGDWEVICWHTDDDDVVYLELEMDLGNGWRVQRQMLLAGHDRFLLACDSILGGRVAQIDYECSLPLASSTRFEHADETREGLLITGRRRRLVLPLALPEWQVERAAGLLQMTDRGLTLCQSVDAAAGLFAPLFVDLDPARSRLPRTWRRLTVAEQLQVVPHDVAIGFRVQIGPKQWLAYRSFRQPSNRSVLGQNVAIECLVARFKRTGDVTELLEIE